MPRQLTARKLAPAISAEALFAKSQLYIQKALLRKEEGNLDEYQLWASLALELLGKSALARHHPSLIADPTHRSSIFAAAGINISAEVRTIGAHTLFDRLRHLAPTFDEKVKTFCVAIAERRNAELHSGETPFRSMRVDAWQAQYWHAAQIILGLQGSTLDDWLGSSLAATPKAILKHADEAKRLAVTIRLQRAKELFFERKRAERERALADAASRQAFHYSGLFTLSGDKEWEVTCPACGGKAFFAGVQTAEDVIDTYTDDEGAWESVETWYSAEQFHCPVCDLELDGADEIAAAELDGEYSDTDDREMAYEPEYGNE